MCHGDTRKGNEMVKSKNTKKIEKLNSDIVQIEAEIAEKQKKLEEMKKERTELENVEIVSLVRGASLSVDDVAEIISGYSPVVKKGFDKPEQQNMKGNEN